MNRARRILVIGFLSALSLIPASCLAAPDDPSSIWHPQSFGMAVIATVVFGFVGIVLAIVGFKLFDAVTPFNLEREMCENKNVAVGILCGAIVLGICVIVAAAIM